MGLAVSEGTFSAGGAGFVNDGAGYEMNLGAIDDYDTLTKLIQEK
jgi:hypothetical protein